MENFKVEDMKVGDSFEWMMKDDPQTIFTTTKVSEEYYESTWTNAHGDSYKEGVEGIIGYTKDTNYKLLKVNFKNTFTKSDLTSGEHIVETSEGLHYLVAGDYLIGVKGYNSLSSYSEDFKHRSYACLDIVKVFSGGDVDYICAGNGFEDYLKNEKPTTLEQKYLDLSGMFSLS